MEKLIKSILDTYSIKIKNIIILDWLHYGKSSATSVFSTSFSVLCAPFSMLGGPSGTSCDEVRFPVHDFAKISWVLNGKTIQFEHCADGAHGTENRLLKTQVSEDFASEMNLIILFFLFQEKILIWIGTLDLQISSLALYNFSYPG